MRHGIVGQGIGTEADIRFERTEGLGRSKDAFACSGTTERQIGQREQLLGVESADDYVVICDL